MKYLIDNDLHIHSQLSSCSSDPEQTTKAILEYGEKNGLTTLCLTDHFWDQKVDGCSDWYRPQDLEHVKSALPLPQKEGMRFFFGCETEMDRFDRLGIAKETFDLFDFVIIPTTHLHMDGFTIREEEMSVEGRAKAWARRFEALLNKDIPFEKVGIAHLTCPLIYNKGNHHDVTRLISDETMNDLFAGAAEKGLGIELNMPILRYQGNELEEELRPYRIAKEKGCKFYFGSDAHHPAGLANAMVNFNTMAELLQLCEDDKFHPAGF